MIAGLFRCCLPNDKSIVIKENDVNMGQSDVASCTEDGMSHLKLGNMFTMAEKQNGQMKQVKVSHKKQTTKTLLLDRLKIYNETQDVEIFKSRIGQASCIMEVKSPNKNENINKEKTPSVISQIIFRKLRLKFF